MRNITTAPVLPAPERFMHLIMHAVSPKNATSYKTKLYLLNSKNEIEANKFSANIRRFYRRK